MNDNKTLKDHQQMELKQILTLNVSTPIKISLLESLIAKLRQYTQQDTRKLQWDNFSTCMSQVQSEISYDDNAIQQLESKILQKQVVRFQLNEDIETIQQEIYQVQKTVNTKRLFNDKLQRQIDIILDDIQQIENYKRKEIPHNLLTPNSYANKSLGSMLKGIFK